MMLELLQGPIFKVLPDFAIIGLGAILAKGFHRKIDARGWIALDALNFYVLFPALLFTATSSRLIAADRLVQIGVLCCAVVFVAFGLVLALRRFAPTGWTPERWLDYAAGAQNAWRFSTPLAFVVAQVMPPEVITLLAAGIGVTIPLVNALAVLALSRGAGSRLETLIGVLTNPFFLASIAGIVVNVTRLPLPDMATTMLHRLSDAALPMILLSIGAALNWSLVLRPNRFALSVHGIRLLVLPALVCLVVLVTGSQGMLAAAVLIFSSLPTSSSSHLLASKFGADQTRVAAIVTQSNVLGCVTLPCWALLALGWVA